MNKELYQLLISGTMQECSSTLTARGNEYASKENMFDNFEAAAALQGITKEQALCGMMAKHLVSINKMVWSGKEFPKEKWQEKIGDGINYLLILSAMVKK